MEGRVHMVGATALRRYYHRRNPILSLLRITMGNAVRYAHTVFKLWPR